MVKISVIIPTYNKGGRLALTLKSFCCQTTSIPYEIILVDGGEIPDNEVERFMSQIPLRIIRVKNHGRSATRNAGIWASKGELLIFCDADLIVEPEYIDAHWMAHKSKSKTLIHGRKKEIPYVRFFEDPRNPHKGLLKEYKDYTLSNKIMNFNITEEDISNNMDKIRRLGHAQDRLERTVQHMFEKGIERYKVPWLAADTANMSLMRAFAIEIGLFREDFGLDWAPEDLEFGYRLYKAGGSFEQTCYRTDAYHLAHARINWKEIAKEGYQLFQKMYPEESLISEIAEVLVEQKGTIDSLLK